MHKALSYLGTLPDDTVVYNGHEYTKASIAFGAHASTSSIVAAISADIIMNMIRLILVTLLSRN